MEWKTYALLATGAEAGFFRRDQGQWRSEPISGEPWTPVKTAKDLAGLLDKLSDRVNDAGGLVKCELLILYEEDARDLLGDPPTALRRLDCRRWEILRAEPQRRWAAAASGGDPGEGWPEAWTCGVFLPQLWRSLRREDPQERAERQRKAEEADGLRAAKTVLEAENRKLTAARAALKTEVQRLRRNEADLKGKIRRLEAASPQALSDRELSRPQNPKITFQHERRSPTGATKPSAKVQERATDPFAHISPEAIQRTASSFERSVSSLLSSLFKDDRSFHTEARDEEGVKGEGGGRSSKPSKLV